MPATNLLPLRRKKMQDLLTLYSGVLVLRLGGIGVDEQSRCILRITWQYTNTVGADARIGLTMEHVSCSYPEAETDMDDQEHRRERPPTRRCSTEGGEICYTYTYEAVQRL